MIPPKPAHRRGRVSLWRYLRLFRRDILSAQPEKLYRAWMAEYRTPFFRSYLCNDPDLVDLVLSRRPADFPKSDRVREGLAPLLGRSVFVTNGAEWQRQRRVIDPAFERGRLRGSFAAMLAAADATVARLADAGGRVVDVEAEMSHATADVIMRALFSVPIEDEIAGRIFDAFRRHQRMQPLLNLGAMLTLPRWMPRLHRRRTLETAAEIRRLIDRMIARRQDELEAGTAPDDLATKLMTTPDPITGARFSPAEMADQVAIFFLAGHETSASGLAWALYLLATHPEVQERARTEVDALPAVPDFAGIAGVRLIRDVFRETLRLYPPVPMMVRENRLAEEFRKRPIRPGAQIILSPWHLHRHERLWDEPDRFDPDRWQGEAARVSARQAYLPFSAGPRVCPGAGFAMIEGVLILTMILRRFRISTGDGPAPVPVAHLTVRSRDGIFLTFTPRHKM